MNFISCGSNEHSCVEELKAFFSGHNLTIVSAKMYKKYTEVDECLLGVKYYLYLVLTTTSVKTFTAKVYVRQKWHFQPWENVWIMTHTKDFIHLTSSMEYLSKRKKENQKEWREYDVDGPFNLLIGREWD